MKDNKQQFLKAFNDLIAKLPGVVTKTVEQVGQRAVQEARSTTAFRNTLKEKTHFVASGLYSGQVVDDREYAYWLENGNDPGGGRIYPTHAKALHFFVNGEEVFAKSVRAHGPYHFVENGRDKAEAEAQSIFEANLKQIL